MNTQNKEILEELEELSPILTKLKKSSAANFRVPDDYFEKLTDSVASKIHFEPAAVSRKEVLTAQPSRWAIFLQNLWQPYRVIQFASLFMLLGAGWWWMSKPQKNILSDATAFSSEEVRSYIDQNLEDFDEQSLIKSTLLEADMESLTPKMEEKDVEKYLHESLDGLTDKDLEKLL